MKMARIALGMMMMAGLSACGSMPGKAPFEALPGEAEMHRAAMTPDVALPGTIAQPAVAAPMPAEAVMAPMRLVSYEVRVPEELTVSEANLYYPIADIVWRGDDYGNRKQQIATIFQNSLSKVRSTGGEGRAVTAEITLNRFHSVTEKTRYTVGGVHSISFFVTLKDARTGEVLVKDRKVKADLNGLGGRRAMLAERQGLGMKERIQRHLDRVIAAELSHPGGWKTGGAPLSRSIDQI